MITMSRNSRSRYEHFEQMDDFNTYWTILSEKVLKTTTYIGVTHLFKQKLKKKNHIYIEPSSNCEQN